MAKPALPKTFGMANAIKLEDLDFDESRRGDPAVVQALESIYLMIYVGLPKK